MKTLHLRPLEDPDVDLVAQWLQSDHVSRWFQNPESWLQEIRERHDTYSFIHHFIVESNDGPVGFCQYYDCHAAKEDWYAVEAPAQVFSIDYLIGDEQNTGKGYGKAIIAALLKRIEADVGNVRVLVQPDADNIPSNIVLQANGFTFDREKKYFEQQL